MLWYRTNYWLTRNIGKTMPRRPNPNRQVNIVRWRRKRADGSYSVCEVRKIYDPAIKRTKSLASKVIGVIPAGKTDLGDMIDIKTYNAGIAEAKQKMADQVTIKRVSPPDNLSSVVEMDPRQQSKVKYPLDVVTLIILLAFFAGNSTCPQIYEYAKTHREVFQTMFPEDYPDSDISHDTVRRIIALIGSNNELDFFSLFTKPLVKQIAEHVISVDGHAIRATRSTRKNPRYTLNVFDCDSGLVLQQKLIDAKRNEITEAAGLMLKLNLTGAIVTADALNTQVNFVDAIIIKHADYVLAIKNNQKCT